MAQIKNLGTLDEALTGTELVAMQEAAGGSGSTKRTTTQAIADLGTGGGQTLVLANDEDKTIAAEAGTTIVLYTALTDSRTVTLPPANGPSQTVIVKDVNGLAGGGPAIGFAPNGTDTVPNPSSITHTLVAGYGSMMVLANDGVSAWHRVGDIDQIIAYAFMGLIPTAIGTAAAIGANAGGADITGNTTLDLTAPAAWMAGIVTALSGPITITLSSTSTLGVGTGLQRLAVVDCTGNCSPTNTITVTCDAADDFMVPGVGLASSIVLDAAYASLLLFCPNEFQWNVLSQLP